MEKTGKQKTWIIPKKELLRGWGRISDLSNKLVNYTEQGGTRQ